MAYERPWSNVGYEMQDKFALSWSVLSVLSLLLDSVIWVYENDVEFFFFWSHQRRKALGSGD